MLNSEVFENYVKISKEQGFISEAAEDDKLNDKSNDKPKDLSSAEIFYGLKPNGKDEKSIIEQAHPETVVVAPSYDLFNGIMTNNEQAQQIAIHNIVNKPPQSLLTQHRYAKQELADELISLGYYLDNEDQTELAILADTCSSNLHKEGVAFLAPLAYSALVAGGLALLGAYNNFAYLSQGVKNDCDNCIDQLDKFADKSPDIKAQLKELSEGIAYVRDLYNKAIEKASGFKALKHNNVIESAAAIKQSPMGQEGFELLEQYKHAASLLASSLVKIYIPLIQTSEPDIDRSSSTLWTGIKTTWHALFGTAKNDLLKALAGANLEIVGQGGLVGSLRASVENIKTKEDAMKAYVEQNKDTLKQYLEEESKKKLTDSKPSITPAGPDGNSQTLTDRLKSDKSHKEYTMPDLGDRFNPGK